MFRHSLLAQAILAIVIMLPCPSVGLAARTPARRAPAGFKVLRSTDASENQRNAMAERLGAKITDLSNTSFLVNGQPLQMNLIRCPSSAEAAKVHKSAAATKTHPAFCILADNTVVEFVCDDPGLATLAAFELGFKPKPDRATYKISFRVAPVEKTDYTAWKNFSNMFASANRDPNNLAFKSRIEMLLGGFRFGNDLVFRTAGDVQTAPSYSFEPKPAKITPLAGGETTQYTFQDLTREVNIPVVSLNATIHTSENPLTPTSRKAGPELLSPTEYWPSDDPEIIKLAAQITANCNTPQQKTDAILKWLLPGRNITFTESLTSARSGVKNVLSQKFGQAWDFSDCFVTLARASKIPSRQVCGWFFSQNAHVWAEVLYEGAGWKQVDPTAGGAIECGIYHIPYTTSEDDSMSILYLSRPQITIIDN